jgi:prolyl-tRNA synthetase
MLQSKLFTKPRKDSPKDEVSKNADLLIRAGFIHKEMAGVYSFLPLGNTVLQNIISIIREEMNAIDGQEIHLSALQKKSIWELTDRWDDAKVDNWFKTKLKNDTELGLAFTHEEPLTALVKDHVNSYRDLPFYAYQFQTKFRNETRAKSGIMRTREFIMKDLYSFSKDEVEHNDFYEKSKEAYTRIFDRIGLGESTYITFASGGSFAKYSHEFQTITDAGEDIIYIDKTKKIAINKEVYTDEVLADLGLKKEDMIEEKAVEVGNIFSLGTKFSDAENLNYKDEKGEEQKVVMGSYGIGPARLMGTVVETLSDENGIVWPESIAPYKVHLVSLGDSGEVKTEAKKVYDALNDQNTSVLWDDRDQRPGQKFAESDLLGLPHRIVVSQKTMEEGIVELKNRKSGDVRKISLQEVLAELK